MNRNTQSNFIDYSAHESGVLHFLIKHNRADTLVENLEGSMVESNAMRDNSGARCFQMMLDAHSVNGKVWVEVDSTDCDLFRSTSLHEVDATLAAYRDFKDYVLEGAEGRTYFRILHPKDVDEWEQQQRDYAAEQMGY